MRPRPFCIPDTLSIVKELIPCCKQLKTRASPPKRQRPQLLPPALRRTAASPQHRFAPWASSSSAPSWRCSTRLSCHRRSPSSWPTSASRLVPPSGSCPSTLWPAASWCPSPPSSSTASPRARSSSAPLACLRRAPFCAPSPRALRPSSSDECCRRQAQACCCPW